MALLCQIKILAVEHDIDQYLLHTNAFGGYCIYEIP